MRPEVLSIIGEHFARAPSIPQLFPPRAPVTMGTCIFALRKQTRGPVQLSPYTQGWRLFELPNNNCSAGPEESAGALHQQRLVLHAFTNTVAVGL